MRSASTVWRLQRFYEAKAVTCSSYLENRSAVIVSPRTRRGEDCMPEYEFVKYESLEGGRIVRILLNRPDTRNAQNRGMLVDLDDAFRTAEKDDEVRVVILGGVGPLFSSGHDMGSKLSQAERETHPSFKGD